MDNGEVIPNLDVGWTFMGAKAPEWGAGVMMALMVSELMFTNPGQGMPVLIMVCFGTTLGMATLRASFPDEENGVRNYLMSLMGLAPPNLPPPAALQPIWSGAPIRELKKNCDFMRLELHNLFDQSPDEETHEIN